MSSYGYPLRAVLGDYLRAGFGIVISAFPLVMVSGKPFVTYLFGGMICLFTVYGLRTVRRHFTRIEVSEDGILTTMPLRRGIAWRELSKLRLKFFSTNRDKSNGWLQLVLTANHGRIAVDSSLDGFREIVTRAMEAARENGLEIDPASVANLAALDSVTAEPHP